MKNWAEALVALVVVAALGWTLSLVGGTGAQDPQEPDNGVEFDPDAAARGEVLVSQAGCLFCHTVDGQTGAAPTFKGLAGAQRPLTTGDFVVADNEYLRRSIIDPAAQIVLGFEDIQMPTTFGEELTSAEIDDLVAFINSLGS